MSSTLHNAFRYFKTASFFELSTCILTIKGQYYAYTHFVRQSIET
jgi:hypothetical protein